MNKLAITMCMTIYLIMKMFKMKITKVLTVFNISV